MSIALKISSFQAVPSKFMSMVREALVTSVDVRAAVGAAGQMPDQPGINVTKQGRLLSPLPRAVPQRYRAAT